MTDVEVLGMVLGLVGLITLSMTGALVLFVSSHK